MTDDLLSDELLEEAMALLIGLECPSTNCANTGRPAHTCPYAEDIHNDSETLCYCCDDCAHDCAMGI